VVTKISPVVNLAFVADFWKPEAIQLLIDEHEIAVSPLSVEGVAVNTGSSCQDTPPSEVESTSGEPFLAPKFPTSTAARQCVPSGHVSEVTAPGMFGIQFEVHVTPESVVRNSSIDAD
jgi:hypothetical protein